MALPRIPNPQGTVTIPAVAAKEFADLFLTGVMINVPAQLADHWLVIRSRPFNYDTGELHPDESLEQVHREGSIYALAQQYPAIAQAMGLVVAACKNLLALRKAEADRDPLKRTRDQLQGVVTSWNAELETLQARLDNLEAAQSALPPDAPEDQVATLAAEVTACTGELQAAQEILSDRQQELAAAETALTAAQVVVDQCAAVLGA